MENIFKQYISEPRYAEYLSINKATTMISKEQAYDDLHMLRYLMGNRYCGWEYYENHVVIWEACFKSIENFISSENEIYISDFCRAIYGAFNVGIVDNHLSFCSPLTGRLSYAKQFAAYFADFKVEQRGELCYAVDSTCAGIADGDVIDAGSCLYPTLSPTSHKRFLVGTRAFTPITEMTVTVNGKPICIPLHRCKAIHKTESHDVCLRHEIKENIDILRSNCCDYVGELSEKTDFVEFGKKFRDKRFLILNYLSNEGGYGGQ